MPLSSSLSSSRLSEALAWDIALTWRASLRGRVALATDRAGVASGLVKSYQWIQLDLRSLHDGAHGRATVVAWFWLACCPGFSGLENPQFWKRVFCELQPPALSARCQEPITDAVRFFDVPGNEFPRVQFDYVDAASTRRSTHGRSSALRRFLGHENLDGSEDTTATVLREIYHKLQRYMLPSRMARAIPVSVHEVDFPAVRAVLQRVRASDTVSLPRFEALARARASPTWTPERARRAVPNYFLSLFTTDPSSETATTLKAFSRLRLERDRLAPHLVQRVCSAAPHSRAIHTLHFKTTTHRSRYDARTSRTVSEPVVYPEFSRIEWAWIGYALFHPDAAQSAIRTLKIGLHGINREAIEILKLMKRGNHLHSIATGSVRATSTCYYTAQLREGSAVRRSASDSSEQLLIADADLPVTLCVDEISTLPTWVRVAVPGLGLAWVRSSDVVSVTSRAPSTPPLESLRVDLTAAHESNAVLAFVRIMGANLKHLDVSACPDVGASKLRLVLEACPRLESLSVQHDGSLWASNRDTRSLPRLHELCLKVAGTAFSVPSLHKSLQKLLALRIVATQPCGDATRAAIVDAITTHRALEYFHWSSPDSPEQPVRSTYADGLAYTHTVLNGLPKRRPSEVQALAFLAAVRSRQGSPCAVGALNSDVAANILAFAKDRTARTFWVGA